MANPESECLTVQKNRSLHSALSGPLEVTRGTCLNNPHGIPTSLMTYHIAEKSCCKTPGSNNKPLSPESGTSECQAAQLIQVCCWSRGQCKCIKCYWHCHNHCRIGRCTTPMQTLVWLLILPNIVNSCRSRII